MTNTIKIRNFGAVLSLIASSAIPAISLAGTSSPSTTGSAMVNVGALIGVSFLNSDLGNQILLGLTGNYRLLPNVAIGGYATYNSVTSFPTISSSLFTIAPEASYVFEDIGALSGLRFGVKAGIGILHQGSGVTSLPGGQTVSIPGDTSTSFVFGPHLAYDCPILSGISVGAETNYLFYTGHDGYNAFNLAGTIKYWF